MSNSGSFSKIWRKNPYLEILNSKIWKKKHYLEILIQKLEGKTTTLKFFSSFLTNTYDYEFCSGMIIVSAWLRTQIWFKWVSQFHRKIRSQGEKSNNLAMEDNKCLSKTGKTEIQPQPNRLFSLTATSTTTAPTSTAGRNQVFSLECCLRNHPCITSEKDWMGGSKGQLISLWLFDVLKFPKNQRKFWRISALESRNWLNWKNKGTTNLCQVAPD